MSFFAKTSFPDCIFTVKSIGQFYAEFKADDIIIHPCQRNLVWSTKLKQAFLETISKKGPITGPQLNKESRTGRNEIMDGQNRLRTIFDFMDGKLIFKNEEDESISYSDMSVIEQRKFRSIKISHTETTGWSSDDCEEHFRSIQASMPLNSGEIINSASKNMISTAIRSICSGFQVFLELPVKEGGLGVTMLRYKHFEMVGTLLNMCIHDAFPQKSGGTSLKLFNDYNGTSSLLQDSVATVIRILQTYKGLVHEVPELRKGKEGMWHSATGEAHLYRSLYFIYKAKLYENELSEREMKQFQHMIVETHLINTHEKHVMWDEMVKCGTGDVHKVYDIYEGFYEEGSTEVYQPDSTD
jgi:hypothetical protein